MHVSVVVSAYNLERYIASTIGSIYAQSYEDWDLIVVDDGSSDDTASVARQAIKDERGIVVSRRNGGAAAARNAGISRARGPLIALCDGDDHWFPEKLSRQMEVFVTRRDALTVSSGWVGWYPAESGYFEDPEKLRRPVSGELGGITEISYGRLIEEAGICTSAAVFYKDVAQRVGGFEESLPCGEDYDFWLKMSWEAPILRLDEQLVAYRKHRASLTATSALTANYRAVAVDKAISRWGWRGPAGEHISRSAVRRGLVRSWQDFADASIAAGHRRAALGAIVSALRHDPVALRTWKIALRIARE